MKSADVFKYGKSVTAYFGASLIPMLLMVVINPFIAMNMSPEDYAISGYYNSFSSLMSPVIVFYMLNYYCKNYYEVGSESRLRLKAMLFKALIFFSFAMAVICLALLTGYICIFKKDLSFPIYPYAAIMVFAIPLTGVYKLEQTECRMSRNVKGFFNITVAAGMILVIMNLLFVVIAKLGALGKLLAPFVTNLLVFIWLLAKHRDLFKVRTSFEEFKKTLIFCLPLAAGAMLGYFSNGFDRTYLESIGNVTEYGYYIVGAQIAGYLTLLSNAVTSVFQPDIYESIAKGNRKSLFRACSVQIGIILFLVLFFILFCPLIIRILTAGRYVSSTPYARIISISVLTSSVYYIINNYTIAIGKPRLYLYTTIIGSILIVAAYPLMVGRFGYSGGAYMTGISFVLLAAVNLVLLGICSLEPHKRNKDFA